MQSGHKVYVVTTNTADTSLATEVKKCYGVNASFIFPDSGYIPCFVHTSLKICKKEKIDIIHGTSPGMGAAIAAYIVHKITKIPFVFEVRDPSVRPFRFKEKSSSYYYSESSKGKVLTKIIKDMVYAASRILVTNPTIKNEMQELFGVSNEKFRVIYNGVDLEEFKEVSPKVFENYTILYAGTVYRTRSINNLISALRFVDAKLVVAGSGEITYLREMAKNEGVMDKVVFAGLLPHDEILKYQSGADLLFLGLDPHSLLLKYALPSKVFEYMASGKPILSISFPGGDLDMFVNKYRVGISSPPDPESIAKSIQLLQKNKALSAEYGANGLKAVKDMFNREKQTALLIKEYESLVG